MNLRKGLFPSEREAIKNFLMQDDKHAESFDFALLKDCPTITLGDFAFFLENMMSCNYLGSKLQALEKEGIVLVKWDYIFTCLNMSSSKIENEHKRISELLILHLLNDKTDYIFNKIKQSENGFKNIVDMDEKYYCITNSVAPKSKVVEKFKDSIDMARICSHGLIHGIKVSSFLTEDQVLDYANKFELTREEDIYSVLNHFMDLLGNNTHAIINLRMPAIMECYNPLYEKYKAIMIIKEKENLRDITYVSSQSANKNRI